MKLGENEIPGAREKMGDTEKGYWYFL